ncbi:apses-domain-containing protein [Serendipita vermifera]|nr:apses-domain-containing protein [Serendipita vermifera]
MRRRADGWLNATQILKVAGLDKPQRTRVLEREVQKGLHEKVQGGYGKYQGTWVPPDAALAIARQYDVEAQLRPIIDYKPSDDSPPPAPKHTVASNNLVPPVVKTSRHRSPSGYSSARTRSARHRSTSQESESDRGTYSPGDATSEPEATPSPVNSILTHSLDEQDSNQSSRKRKRGSSEGEAAAAVDFSDTMLEYFISETAQIPEMLINPPPDLNPDIEIDDDGHSALHWAAAMGRIRVVKLLLSARADPFKCNKSGQTALMRAVMFANNYDIRKFAELYELLHRTTLNIDNYNRTVFHHIVDLALTKGRIHAARYYMETALVRLADYPKELADIIDFQDKEGETALTMAARCRSKRLVKALLDHGANPNIRNKDGKSAEDYIVDDERFRSSPTIAARTLFRIGSLDPKTQESAATVRAGTEISNAVAEKFDELLLRLDTETKSREKEIAQATGILAQLEREVEATQRAIDELRKKDEESLTARKEILAQQEAEIKSEIMNQCRLGMLQWLYDEQLREENLWKSDRGLTKDNIASSAPQDLKGSSPDQDMTDVAELYANIPVEAGARAALCEDLRGELLNLGTQMEEMITDYVHNLANSGISEKGDEYRRLIAAVWPNMAQNELDGVLGEVLKVLEAS